MEWARLVMKRAPILRLHEGVITATWPEGPGKEAILRALQQQEIDEQPLLELLREYRAGLEDSEHWLAKTLDTILESRFLLDEYPGNERGLILSIPANESDGGADESSTGRPVTLQAHLANVRQEAERFASALLAENPDLRQDCIDAAPLHDIGKSDPRFQVLLHGGDSFAARFSPALLAKGHMLRLTRFQRGSHWKKSQLPDGFRHELVSLLLLGENPEKHYSDLLLHLVASHHGRCRPFAPVVMDDSEGFAHADYSVTSKDRLERAAHRIDSGIADRFWRLTRHHGWWGLAYLETIFRLADWSASAKEQQEEPIKLRPEKNS
jgi:CRISPR-associated endonuclease/helicase Cas3